MNIYKVKTMKKVNFMNIKGYFKTNDIKLISKDNVSKDKYIFNFEKPSNTSWKPIEGGVFKFKDTLLKGGNSRIFSIASSDREEIIKIGTNISESPSEFKLKLKHMKVGEKISLRGPYGFLSLNHLEKPLALIAGGTGITPVRAILKDIEEVKDIKDVTVFYVDSSESFLFKKDLEEIALNNVKININFIEDRASFNDELLGYVSTHKNKANYFISGSPAMVKNVKNDLKLNKIKLKNIVYHSFWNISKFF